VPRNLKRYYGAGDLHFMTCSCYQRRPWLGSARRRDLLLAVLEQVRRRYGVVVLGCVMRALKLGFARRLLGSRRAKQQPRLWKDTAPAHVWQRRFYDFNV
jgi:putative transposase